MDNNFHSSFIVPREFLIQKMPVGTICKFGDIPLSYYAVFNPKEDNDVNCNSRDFNLFVKCSKDKATNVCLKSTFLRAGFDAITATIEDIKSIGKDKGEFFHDDTIVEIMGHLETRSRHEQRSYPNQRVKIIPIRS